MPKKKLVPILVEAAPPAPMCTVEAWRLYGYLHIDIVSADRTHRACAKSIHRRPHPSDWSWLFEAKYHLDLLAKATGGEIHDLTGLDLMATPNVNPDQTIAVI